MACSNWVAREAARIRHGVACALLLLCGGGALAATASDDTGQWQLEALLEPDPGPPPAQLGAAVAITPKRAVVGNRRNHDLGSDSGVVHSYDLVRKAWRLTQLVRDPGGCLTCDFGAALDMDGERLIVGSPRDGALGFESGRAHVFLRRGTKWVIEGTLARLKPMPADLFGHSVAISGRVAVIGAPYSDLAAPAPGEGATPDCGAADVFEFVNGRWQHVAALAPPEPGTSAWFGSAVAVDGDLIAIGAHGQSDGLAAKGSVHLYRRGVEGWTLEQTLQCPWSGTAWFGYAIAIDSDRVLVGAPRARAANTEISTGAAFLYERRAASHELVATLGAPWLRAGDGFGLSVALDRDALFVGAPGDDEAGEDAGAAYLFVLGGSAMRPAERLMIPALGNGDQAGARLASTRGRVIAGRGGNPELDPRPGEGTAWIFTSPVVKPPPRTSSTTGDRAPTPRRSQTRGRSRRATAQASRTG